MLVKIFGSAVVGVEAVCVQVEVNVDKGIAYHLVGLPDSAIKESSYRISAALKNSGYRLPGKKITINLAPADMKKEGAAYDLPIAMGIMAASGQLRSDRLKDYLMMGELSLDGSLKAIRGVLPIAVQAKKDGFRGLVLPEANGREASVVDGLEVRAARDLSQVIAFFQDKATLKPVEYSSESASIHQSERDEPDFSDVKGQESIKRGMEIAAAGGHNIILIGPPGAGKSMLAKRLPGILPPMTALEALETTKIHSVAGRVKDNLGLLKTRPFRAPHHTISNVALVGGGSYPLPGEISLAHNGVLFLDELPEFKRSVLEVMRQPLEDREVTISRSRITLTYPSSFMLIASMNPSPGGQFLDKENATSGVLLGARRYLNRISGPLMDRIDLHMEVQPVPFEKLSDHRRGETSRAIRIRVSKARRLQNLRFESMTDTHYNAQMGPRQIKEFCVLDQDASRLLKKAMNDLGLSARAYDRILKVSRTIADLENEKQICTHHVAEAIQYRSLDRGGWFGLES